MRPTLPGVPLSGEPLIGRSAYSGGQIAFEWMRINPDGTFGFSGTGDGTVDGMPAQYSLSIFGRFSGGAATGTIETATAFTYGGTAYSCKSGVVTFTATRTG